MPLSSVSERAVYFKAKSEEVTYQIKSFVHYRNNLELYNMHNQLISRNLALAQEEKK